MEENNELKIYIESARIARGLSQRKLAKQIGLSQSTYNDTINGKIKKVDIEILRKIAEGLNLSLDKLIKLSGYGNIYFYMNTEKYSNKSTADFIELMESYEKFQNDILDWDFQKRHKALDLLNKINSIETEIKIFSEDGESKITCKKLLEELSGVSEGLKEIAKKYDYSKLPKNI